MPRIVLMVAVAGLLAIGCSSQNLPEPEVPVVAVSCVNEDLYETRYGDDELSHNPCTHSSSTLQRAACRLDNPPREVVVGSETRCYKPDGSLASIDGRVVGNLEYGNMLSE